MLPSQGFVRSTTKYWVRTTDVTAVKHHILQHMPVFLFKEEVRLAGLTPGGSSPFYNPAASLEPGHGVTKILAALQDDPSQGDAQLVNSAYLDNDSMELYHGRLDKKPNAIALRLRWCAPCDRAASLAHSATWSHYRAHT